MASRWWRWAMAMVLVCSTSFAGRGNTFALDLTVGAPHIATVDLAYEQWNYFSVGIGFGTLPVNQILNDAIPADSVSLDLGLEDPYTLVPSTRYTFYTISAFVRYYPAGKKKGWSGFFVELNVSRLKFSANLSGSLRNETTGGVFSNALSGGISFSQPIATLGVGYRVSFLKSFFAHFALGASYLFNPEFSTSVGGTLTSVLPVAPSGEGADDFEEAKNQINNQINDGIQSARASTKWIPALYLGIGWAF